MDHGDGVPGPFVRLQQNCRYDKITVVLFGKFFIERG